MPEKLTEISCPAQRTTSATGFMVGRGDTITVKLAVGPLQPLSLGVMTTVAVWVVVTVLAVPVTLPDPEAGSPVLVLLTVQL